MATWTAATAIPSGGLITSAWMNNVTGMVNFLGASSATAGKDLAFLTQTSSQNLASGTDTALTFDSEVFDVATGHSITTQTSRYTVAATGKYFVQAQVYMSAGGAASDSFQVRLYVNGLDTAASRVVWTNQTVSYSGFYTTGLIGISLTAGQYLECRIRPTFAASTASGAAAPSTFSIQWVGA